MSSLRPAVPPAVAASPPGEEPETSPVWVPTRALSRAIMLAGLLLVIGVVLGRTDVVLLATPFVIGTAVSLRRRPAAAPDLALTIEAVNRVEGGDVVAELEVINRDRVDYDLVLVRVRRSRWLRVDAADRPHGLAVDAGRTGLIDLAGRGLRWGRHDLGPIAAAAAACDGLFTSAPVLLRPARIAVYPRTEPFQAVDAMPNAAGLVGGHRSRRPGQSGELAGVRKFGPGDRLRRIDWRVSLRAGELHVAATLSDRDAEVALLLDVTAETGNSGGVDGGASVLDTTVRAAAAIAEHYLHRGDRVSLLEYGPAARRLRAAAGRRQYLTVLEWLLEVRQQGSVGEGADPVATHLVSANALVVVLTPLLEPGAAEMLARLARSGRYVVAVDTLPGTGLSLPGGSPWVEQALRLWRLERENTLGRLREHGVPVVSWAGAGSLDLVLRDIARFAGAPRAGVR
ncbi:hypothetical protein JCM9533A_43340 [Catenuloplanes niger JCM 9533]|uniref:Uncharacterized protein (DUF58 family) n=1 Tax=Catenuloplanes niger TaxID=587534 RepID=A0AAE3ZPV8_9ACTN|nr:DUF58 domain-containing protein [Catenuloplanes niger]MDR7322716.1 uncharacterized protein (DUF58 family) [Catenuloplanes niger]